MKVLVAVDGSEQSLKAVQRALEMVEQEKAQVTLMSVAYYAREDLDEMPMNIQDKLESQAKEALQKGKNLFDVKGFPVDTVIESGFVPANNIIKKAKDGAFDKIILGSTGWKPLKEILIGSTAAKVVANAPCTVTIVR